MAKKRIAFIRRRSASLTVTALLAVALLVAYFAYSPTYPRHAYLSGWVLFAVMLFLTFYNLRKRVPFLRIGSSRFWMQLHLYVGILSGVLFLLHIGWSWPSGPLLQLLTVLFAVVFLSGWLGLWISRAFPRMLTDAGYETPYERIPIVRGRLREEAEALVLAGVDGTTSPIAAEFYTRHLGMFFTRPCNRWTHLRQSRAAQAAHDLKFDEARRYVRKGELELLDKLSDLVARKHMLDYQYSLQSAMRLWLFVHIPISYSLLVFSVLHIIVIYAFSGAAP